jgi:hypothetical protein
MEKTIYDTYIRVTSQEQCDRLKQICIDNELKIWDDAVAFEFDGINSEPLFEYCLDYGFAIYNNHFTPYVNNEVTESEWIELLKQETLPLQQRIDKAIEYLESFNEEDRNLYLINILRYGKKVD